MKRAVLLCALAACSVPGQHVLQTPTPSALSSSQIASQSQSSVAIQFDSERAYATVVELASSIGPREDTNTGFTRAVAFVVNSFKGYGYTIRRMPVAVPAGTSAGHPVPAGTTFNVIATPSGFDATKPHLIVGAHLDTVVAAPGAIDNASGVAVMLELARLASLQATPMPIEWVAFGGEERRLKGSSGALFGSRALYASMPLRERDALRGMIAIDVIGKGPIQISSGGVTPHWILKSLSESARKLGIPAEQTIMTRLFSDHKVFEDNGYPVGWLWTGPFPQLHTPRDTVDLIDRSSLANVGRIIWETLQTLRL
ncbi:MAG: M28 family metallopeptidase [Actinomycetota bacterium]